MQVIPVIDIRAGEVVHATGGDRAAYQPIRTPLAEGSDPVAVARGLLTATGGRSLYVADLDGIAGGRWNAASVHALVAGLPGVTLWLDTGIARAHDLAPLLGLAGVVPVVGSETLAEAGELAEVDELTRPHAGYVLSLDFKGAKFLGAPGVLADPAVWPVRVVVMTLAAVGADAGPDLDRVRQVKALAGEARAVYAAGGVREAADLAALARVGAAGVLVASALHTKKIEAGDLS